MTSNNTSRAILHTMLMKWHATLLTAQCRPGARAAAAATSAARTNADAPVKHSHTRLTSFGLHVARSIAEAINAAADGAGGCSECQGIGAVVGRAIVPLTSCQSSDGLVSTQLLKSSSLVLLKCSAHWTDQP